jgi:hypothetical protein
LELPIRHHEQDRIDYDNVETFRQGQVEQVKPLERVPARSGLCRHISRDDSASSPPTSSRYGQGAAKVKQKVTRRATDRAVLQAQIGEIN